MQMNNMRIKVRLINHEYSCRRLKKNFDAFFVGKDIENALLSKIILKTGNDFYRQCVHKVTKLHCVIFFWSMYRLPVSYCNLFVRDITRTLSFCVPGELTVGDFKEAIAASTGVRRAEQRLMYGNKLLQNSEQCRQYNECNINLCCSLNGGNICNICGNANPD